MLVRSRSHYATGLFKHVFLQVFMSGDFGAFVFDLEANEWTEASPPRTRRYAACGAYVDSTSAEKEFVIAGGYDFEVRIFFGGTNHSIRRTFLYRFCVLIFFCFMISFLVSKNGTKNGNFGPVFLTFLRYCFCPLPEL